MSDDEITLVGSPEEARTEARCKALDHVERQRRFENQPWPLLFGVSTRLMVAIREGDQGRVAVRVEDGVSLFHATMEPDFARRVVGAIDVACASVPSRTGIDSRIEKELSPVADLKVGSYLAVFRPLEIPSSIRIDMVGVRGQHQQISALFGESVAGALADQLHSVLSACPRWRGPGLPPGSA